MKRSIFFGIIFIFNFNFCYCQNKTQPNQESTQKWIKEKLELHSPIVYNMVTQMDEKAIREVKFENCNMIIVDRGSTGKGSQTTIIPLKYIYIPTYTENPNWKENMEIVFVVSSREKLIKNTLIYTNGTTTETVYLNQVSIMISKKFKEENLPERFNKAFKNLITVCEGKLNDEVY